LDTLITLAIVSIAAAWAALRIWRRASAKPAPCAGGCSGCGGSRGPQRTASSCPEGSDTPSPRAGAATGIPFPSLSEKKG
jgi:hypothetical protein